MVELAHTNPARTPNQRDTSYCTWKSFCFVFWPIPKGDLLRAIVSLCVNTGRPLNDLITAEHPHFLPQLDAIRAVVHRYLERKVAANGMDYDDLLLNFKNVPTL